jgi:hypothetical protein
MTLCELDTSWVLTHWERNYLRRELLACDEVRGGFPTTQADVLTVLYDGDRPDFEEWASTRVTDGEELSEARQ